MTCRTITAAADEAAVHRKTLQRWMRQEAFQAALVAAQAEIFAESERRVLQLSAKADEALSDALEHGTMAERIRAAIAVKTLVQDIHEFNVMTMLTNILERERQRALSYERQETEDS